MLLWDTHSTTSCPTSSGSNMIQQEKGYTRKQFIEDAVSVYIKNNPEEFRSFKVLMEQRRTMLLTDFGELRNVVKGKIKADEDSFRIAVSLPSKLNNTFQAILSTDAEGDFPKDKQELHWFMRKFPNFTMPKKV